MIRIPILAVFGFALLQFAFAAESRGQSPTIYIEATVDQVDQALEHVFAPDNVLSGTLQWEPQEWDQQQQEHGEVFLEGPFRAALTIDRNHVLLASATHTEQVLARIQRLPAETGRAMWTHFAIPLILEFGSSELPIQVWLEFWLEEQGSGIVSDAIMHAQNAPDHSGRFRWTFYDRANDARLEINGTISVLRFEFNTTVTAQPSADDLTRAIRDLDNALLDAQRRLAAAEERALHWESEAQRLQSLLEATIASHNDERDHLQTEIEQLMDAASQLEEKLTAEQKDKEALYQLLRTAHEDKQTLTDQLAQLNAQIQAQSESQASIPDASQRSSSKIAADTTASEASSLEAAQPAFAPRPTPAFPPDHAVSEPSIDNASETPAAPSSRRSVWRRGPRF